VRGTGDAAVWTTCWTTSFLCYKTGMSKTPNPVAKRSGAEGARPLRATPLAGVKVSSLGDRVVFAPLGPSWVTPLPYPGLVLFKGPASGSGAGEAPRSDYPTAPKRSKGRIHA
jgi:hypothetical protein